MEQIYIEHMLYLEHSLRSCGNISEQNGYIFFKYRQTKNEKVNDSVCYTLMRIRGLGDKTE